MQTYIIRVMKSEIFFQEDEMLIMSKDGIQKQ